MTQLDYYTNILANVVGTIVIVGGLFSLGLFLTGAYYLYPWVKK
jgi:hypothetical protein